MDANNRASAVDKAEPLAILPGLMCDSTMFSAQCDAFNAVVIDGFYGGADAIEAMADYAIARLPGRCALVGHSMGARIALEIWRREPGRIARLMFANTGVHDVGEREAAGRYALRDIGRSNGIDALANTWLARMIGPAHRGDDALTDRLCGMCCAAGLAVYEAQIEALLNRPECASLLPTIACPTFVIAGRDDEWSPVDQLAGIASQIPRAQMRVIENAGHLAPAEEPDRFNAVIREWLAWPDRDQPAN